MEELAGYGISRPFTIKSQRGSHGDFFSRTSWDMLESVLVSKEFLHGNFQCSF